MFTKQEQRCWLKIQSARGRTARQCYDGLVEACGEAALPYRTVARWVRAFNEGRDRVEHMARPGRPSVSEEEVQAVSALLDNDRRQTVRELAQEIGMSHMTVFRILKNRLKMRKIASRWVPWDLTEAQRWIRYDAAQTHLERYDREGDAFLRRIVALDETWARSYEPLLKRQSNEWRHHGSPRKTVVRRTPTNVKVMVIIAYDCDGVILTHTVPQRQNVNAHYFRHFLQHNLRPALRRKRPHVLQNPPIILQDNARAHVAHPVADLYRRWGWEVLYHPPHSPDLSPCDYDLIPKMKEPLRDVRFQTVHDILQALGRSIRNINRTGAATGILRLPHRWQRVIDNAGHYFEGQ